MASTRGGTAADYVADANGRPIVGAEVEVRATAADAGTLIHTTTSGANGLIAAFTVPSTYDGVDVFWRARKGAGAWSAWVRLPGDLTSAADVAALDTRLDAAEVSLPTKETPAGAQAKADAAQAAAIAASEPVGLSAATETALAATYIGRASTYAAAGAAPGFHERVSLDYDTTNTTLPEPLLVETKYGGMFQRGTWLNESGSIRAASVKNEPAAKFYGPSADTAYQGPVVEILDKHTGTQTHLYGIDRLGRPLLGANRLPGAHTIALGPGEPSPAGLPAGTVVARYEATQILTNPNFAATITGWSGSQSTQAWSSTGGRTDAGCLKMTAGGTGTRSFSSDWFTPVAGASYSASVYLKWLTGGTPREMGIDIQFGTGGTATTTISGPTITPNTSTYTIASVLNAVCPASGADQMRVRVRMLNAASTDEALVDDGWFWRNPSEVALDAAFARKDSAPFNVKDYGAVGDGTTSDNAAINAAITAANAAGGGVVVLPYTAAGYGVSALTLKTGVTLRGHNKVKLKKVGASSAILVQTATGATDCGVEDLTFELGGLITSYALQFSTNTVRSFARRCAFTDTFVALNAIETRDGTADISVTECGFDGFLVSVRINQNPQRVLVNRNRFTNWRNRAVYVLGSATTAVSDLTVEHNHISAANFTAAGDVRQPIQFSGNDAMPFKRVKVNFNTIIGPGTSWTATSNWGTADQISLHRCEDFEVIGNISVNGGDGGITVAQQSQRGVVANNVCIGNDAIGIFLGSSSSTFTRRITVTGNVCINNGQNRQGDRAAANRAGIWPYNASDCHIAGNVLGDDQGAKTQQYGVSMTACTNLLLGNLDAGNAVALNIKNGAANTNINAYSTVAV